MTDHAPESDSNDTHAGVATDDHTDTQAHTQPGAKRVHVKYEDETDAPSDAATGAAAGAATDAQAEDTQAADVPTIDVQTAATETATTETATHSDVSAGQDATAEAAERTSDAFAAFHEASSADTEIEILRNELDQAHAELSTLKQQQAELEAATQQAQEMKDKFLRARADLENYRRRAAKDVERARDSGADSVILAVVPVYDDLGRALEAGVKDPSTLIPGIEAVRAGLERNLSALGIKQVGEIGEPFDPTYHEALSSIPAADDEHKGNIAQVFQVGFAKDDRLIRPAQVVVYRED